MPVEPVAHLGVKRVFLLETVVPPRQHQQAGVRGAGLQALGAFQRNHRVVLAVNQQDRGLDVRDARHGGDVVKPLANHPFDIAVDQPAQRPERNAVFGQPAAHHLLGVRKG